jgi:hypothetical protein
MRRACSTILFFLALAGPAMPVASQAQVICTGNASPPPELPVYEQPPLHPVTSGSPAIGGLARLDITGFRAPRCCPRQ